MKTQGMSGSQNQKERKTASTVTTTFSDKKSPQRKLASATTTNSVELMNGTTMNIKMTQLARQFPEKWKKIVPQKDRIKD